MPGGVDGRRWIVCSAILAVAVYGVVWLASRHDLKATTKVGHRAALAPWPIARAS